MNPTPASSYIVWHTQRTGSTLLCMALEATQIAGNPQEWPEQLDATSASADDLREQLWREQTTPNGIFGVKFSYYQPTLDTFELIFGPPVESWPSVFPNCRHIMMTRRNKFRLAVSWWKSIQGAPGHLAADEEAKPFSAAENLVDAYDFRAIKALAFESIEREAAIGELLDSLHATPLVVTYEDFIADYDATVENVLSFLGITEARTIPPPQLRPTTDEVNETWLQRFMDDLARSGP